MKIGLLTTAILALTALPLLAGPQAQSPASPAGPGDSGVRDLACVFSQTEYDSLGAATSQVDVDYPFEAWVADDFICDPCLPVTHIEWGGGHWGYATFGHPSGFLIWIWEDEGDYTRAGLAGAWLVALRACVGLGEEARRIVLPVIGAGGWKGRMSEYGRVVGEVLAQFDEPRDSSSFPIRELVVVAADGLDGEQIEAEICRFL